MLLTLCISVIQYNKVKLGGPPRRPKKSGENNIAMKTVGKTAKW